MAEEGRLRLDLVDVYGERIRQRVRIFLKHTVFNDTRLARDVDASKQVVITGLRGAPQAIYSVEVDAPSYLTVSQFVNASGTSSHTVVLPVDASRVLSAQFPEYDALPQEHRRLLESSSHVIGFAGMKGGALYCALDNIRKAGFLNLTAKAARTRFSNGETVLAHLQTLRELRGDRLFADISNDLAGHTKNSVIEGLFHSVDQSLHDPDPGFEKAGSYKTLDRYANLQLSFYRDAGGQWRVDMDMDDAQGLGHVFQVIRNAVTGEPTHPYTIHELLVFHQKLDPGYRLQVCEAVAAAAQSA